MAQLSLFTGIDKAEIRPFSDHVPPFTAIQLLADGVTVVYLIDHDAHLAFAAHLREIADAIETGEAVTLPKEG